MAHELRHLFTSVRVGGLVLKNRIFSTAHAEAMAEDGKPGARLRAYHEAKARGGAALTMIGGSTSVHPSSPASAWNMIANHDDSIVAGYRAIAEAVHRHDCLVMSQLTHLGRRAQSDSEDWHVLLAPSQIPEKVHREVPHELEPEQIAMLVRAFGDAARRCRDGGLDGVELSFAHNHLADQFWSPLFNRRTDEYGGSLDNRMRFAFEVLGEIRRQAGRDYVVGARISGDELTDGGLDASDMAEIARRLAASGLVDFLSIIGGAAHTQILQAGSVPDMSLPSGRLRSARRRHQGRSPRPADPSRHPDRRSRARGTVPRRPDDRRGRHDAGADRRSRHAEQGARGAAGRHPPVRRGQRGLHRSHLPGEAGDLRAEPGSGARGRARPDPPRADVAADRRGGSGGGGARGRADGRRARASRGPLRARGRRGRAGPAGRSRPPAPNTAASRASSRARWKSSASSASSALRRRRRW